MSFGRGAVGVMDSSNSGRRCGVMTCVRPLRGGKDSNNSKWHLLLKLVASRGNTTLFTTTDDMGRRQPL